MHDSTKNDSMFLFSLHILYVHKFIHIHILYSIDRVDFCLYHLTRSLLLVLVIIEFVGGYQKRRGFFILLVPLQTVEDALLLDILEDKPYAPLSVVSQYLENDPKCDNDSKLKVQNLWEMYSWECLKIDKVCTHIVFLHKF